MPRKLLTMDTSEAVEALMDRLGGGYRSTGRLLGVDHNRLWGALNGNKAPISLDLLAYLANQAAKHGVHFSFTIEPRPDRPEPDLTYQVTIK